MKKIMLSCEETAKFISLSREENIGLWKKLQVKMHNLICAGCSGFNDFVKKTGTILKTKENNKMPAEMLRQIKNKLKDK